MDDQNSLRHFLLYANEVELQGIVQTSSRFHWKGVSDASAAWAADMPLQTQGDTAVFTIPEKAAPGDQLHIVVKAEAAGHHRLVHYQQVIVTVG